METPQLHHSQSIYLLHYSISNEIVHNFLQSSCSETVVA